MPQHERTCHEHAESDGDEHKTEQKETLEDHPNQFHDESGENANDTDADERWQKR